MSRRLELFQVFYTLKNDISDEVKCRFCLAFNSCHAVQVMIRSLVEDGFSLSDIEYDHVEFIVSYR